MELDVTQALLRPGESFPFEAKVEISPQNVDSESVSFDDVLLKGVYSAIDGTVQLKGDLSTTAYAPCAMCLRDVTFPMNLSFSEIFRKDAVETEDEAFSYQGSKVSLDQMSLTLLMLNLPMRFLCNEACSGDEAMQAYSSTISKSSCQEDTQRPFEALKRLLEEDEEV